MLLIVTEFHYTWHAVYPYYSEGECVHIWNGNDSDRKQNHFMSRPVNTNIITVILELYSGGDINDNLITNITTTLGHHSHAVGALTSHY